MNRKITPKQLQILKLLAEGYSSEEIAKELQNSVNTINNTRLTMLNRFNVKNATHLVAWGFRNGLLE